MKSVSLHRLIEREVETCALAIFFEITRGRVRPEPWYIWFLCERHGGPPLLDMSLPAGQIAFWDGEDIVLDPCVPFAEVVAALPEELAHRLSSQETPRFETLNYDLLHAPALPRAEFQERVGQRVAVLFEGALGIRD